MREPVIVTQWIILAGFFAIPFNLSGPVLNWDLICRLPFQLSTRGWQDGFPPYTIPNAGSVFVAGEIHSDRGGLDGY